VPRHPSPRLEPVAAISALDNLVLAYPAVLAQNNCSSCGPRSNKPLLPHPSLGTSPEPAGMPPDSYIICYGFSCVRKAEFDRPWIASKPQSDLHTEWLRRPFLAFRMETDIRRHSRGASGLFCEKSRSPNNRQSGPIAIAGLVGITRNDER